MKKIRQVIGLLSNRWSEQANGRRNRNLAWSRSSPMD